MQKYKNQQFVSKCITQTIVARLSPQADLKNSLLEIQKLYKIKAGVVISSVGSLKVAQLRLANAKKSKVFQGPFEIIVINGTIGPDGLHCHIGLSDKTGKMLGGHLMDGCIINTTCELTISVLKGFRFERKFDARTGYNELEF